MNELAQEPKCEQCVLVDGLNWIGKRTIYVIITAQRVLLETDIYIMIEYDINVIVRVNTVYQRMPIHMNV